TTELKRYVRNTSSFPEYIDIKRKFYYRLRARGYPKSYLLSVFKQVSYLSRPTLLSRKTLGDNNSVPLIFKTMYNPTTNFLPIRKIINSNWDILRKDSELATVY